MKTKLFVPLLLLVSTALAQPGPYLTLSTGSATFNPEDSGSQTRRRDSVAVGYTITNMLAVEASYFQIQEATYSPVGAPGPGFFDPNYYPTRSGTRLTGYTVGPVLRWQLSDRVTVFTRQMFASIKAKETTWFTGGATYDRNTTLGAWQPSVGIDFRLGGRLPLSLGLEVSHAVVSKYQVKDLTAVLVNFSYGF